MEEGEKRARQKVVSDIVISMLNNGQSPAEIAKSTKVHAIQIAGKEAGLVATCAGTDFHYGVLAVLWVFGDHHQADVLLQLLDARLGSVQLLLGHLAHLLVLLRGQDFLSLLNIGFQGLVFLEGHDNRLQVLIVLVELHELLHVGSHGRVGELFAHFLPSVLYRFEFFGDVHDVKRGYCFSSSFNL